MGGEKQNWVQLGANIYIYIEQHTYLNIYKVPHIYTNTPHRSSECCIPAPLLLVLGLAPGKSFHRWMVAGLCRFLSASEFLRRRWQCTVPNWTKCYIDHLRLKTSRNNFETSLIIPFFIKSFDVFIWDNGPELIAGFSVFASETSETSDTVLTSGLSINIPIWLHYFCYRMKCKGLHIITYTYRDLLRGNISNKSDL